jgi:PAS domain S-box-containing protein
MRQVLEHIKQNVHRMRMAYLVLLLSLVPTGLAYYRVRISVENHDRSRFERVVRDSQMAIAERLPRYVDEMLGVRGLFAANKIVDPDQWQRYLASLEIPQLYPGIRALGYLQRVEANQKSTFQQFMRKTGHPDYRTQPEGERTVYFPVVYLHEFDVNLEGSIGHDFFALPEQRVYLESARDGGRASATARKSFTSQNHGTNYEGIGFDIYLPVYRAGAPTGNVDERKAALQGFIFANCDTSKLFAVIFGSQLTSTVDFEIYDGEQINPRTLLYDDDRIIHAGATHHPRFEQTSKIPVLGRTWTLYFSSLPAFEGESQAYLPLAVLLCGLALSFLLFGITCAQVNARAQAERISADLQKSEAALATEKERLAVTLYSIGDGVITTDTKGCVVSLNKMAEALTGWRQAEAWGKPLGELFHMCHEKTRERYLNPIEKALQNQTVSGPAQPALLVARDGTERVISDTAALIHNKEGKSIGVVLVFRDITEKQKTEAELLKESKLESVGLLAGGIAHDFNNILLGIIGNLSLARMSAHSTDMMLERLVGVEKAALRAKDLTHQLVMFARGGAPIRRQVQLVNIVRDATQFALHGASSHCEFSLPGDLWPVEVDEGQFRQVISNMALNAVQAMEEGGKLEVRAENVELTAGFLPPLAAGRYVKILIRDSGTGIRPEDLPRIFDPYFSTRRHGRGLGLASAYSVVRKHEGQIQVESQLGQGTTFRIYLPAVAVSAVIPPVELTQERFFGQGRVLVMDDEADILALLGEMLKIMGYEVEVARDGGEALQLYMAAKKAEKPFGVVIMDLTVPEGMGGKEAIRRLKEFDPHARAIVSSGYSYDPVMANFREFGFSGVIPKPYVMEELGRVLKEVFGKSEGAQN